MRSWTKSRSFLSSAAVLLASCSDARPAPDPVERVEFEKVSNVVTPPESDSHSFSVSFWSSVPADVFDSRDGGRIGKTPCSFDVDMEMPVCLKSEGYKDHCVVVSPGVSKSFEVDMQPIAQEPARMGRGAGGSAIQVEIHRSEKSIDDALGEIDGIIKTIESGNKRRSRR